MKKTLSLSKDLIERLERIAEEQSTTQSKLVETACTVYIMMNYADPKNTEKLKELLAPQNTLEVYKILGK